MSVERVPKIGPKSLLVLCRDRVVCGHTAQLLGFCTSAVRPDAPPGRRRGERDMAGPGDIALLRGLVERLAARPPRTCAWTRRAAVALIFRVRRGAGRAEGVAVTPEALLRGAAGGGDLEAASVQGAPTDSEPSPSRVHPSGRIRAASGREIPVCCCLRTFFGEFELVSAELVGSAKLDLLRPKLSWSRPSLDRFLRSQWCCCSSKAEPLEAACGH